MSEEKVKVSGWWENEKKLKNFKKWRRKLKIKLSLEKEETEEKGKRKWIKARRKNRKLRLT